MPMPAPGYVSRERLAEAFRAVATDELVWKLRHGGLTPLATEVATAELATRGVDPAQHPLDLGFDAAVKPSETMTTTDRFGAFLLGAIKTLGAAGAGVLVAGAAFWEFGSHGEGGSSTGYLLIVVAVFGLLLTQRIPIVGLALAGATLLFFVSCASNFHWAGG